MIVKFSNSTPSSYAPRDDYARMAQYWCIGRPATIHAVNDKTYEVLLHKAIDTDPETILLVMQDEARLATATDLDVWERYTIRLEVLNHATKAVYEAQKRFEEVCLTHHVHGKATLEDVHAAVKRYKHKVENEVSAADEVTVYAVERKLPFVIQRKSRST